jgi:triphosphoribosyl-dephospho-CoA synthase
MFDADLRSHRPLSQKRQIDSLAFVVARLCVRSLYFELALYPKPGLVSFFDNGSHSDMSAETFFRSLMTLRSAFRDCFLAGFSGVDFTVLKTVGLRAEAKMLKATGGVNTHRGSIFALGLLAAAAGCCCQKGLRLSDHNIRAELMASWGAELARHQQSASQTPGPLSHGQQVAREFAIGGARDEAARAFPAVFEMGLRTLRKKRRQTDHQLQIHLETFFALLAHIEDTNVYHRGGPKAALWLKAAAQNWVEMPSNNFSAKIAQAEEIHRTCILNRWSPGGTADLFAACLFIDSLQAHFLATPEGSMA